MFISAALRRGVCMLVVSLFVGGLGTAVSVARPASALAAGWDVDALGGANANAGGYPWKLSLARPPNEVADPSLFFSTECTSFVAFRLNNTNGFPFQNNVGGVQYGNADHWGSAATALGHAPDNTPAPGAIAWFPTQRWHPSGHVAWVKSVAGAAVTLEEFNYEDSHQYGTRVVTLTGASSGLSTNKETIHFIHIKDLGSGPPAPTPTPRPRPSPAPAQSIDLVFAIDTTGSMSPYINGVIAVSNVIVDTLAASGTNYRIGVVDYKDSDGCGDYDAVTDLNFSNDKTAIINALSSLSAKVGGGCDIPEDVLSGVNRALGYPWRTGVKKAVIAMGDAPGKDPEPHSGLTSAAVLAKAKALDPVIIDPILVGSDPTATKFMTALATGSGGEAFDSNASNVGEAVVNAIVSIVGAPVADAGGPYHAVVGQPVVFSGSSSYSPNGLIVKWEWDFNGDGVFDDSETGPLASHTYGAAFTGTVSLRVTDDAKPAPQAATVQTQVVITEPPAETSPT